MKISLKGKVAWVTGASSGIGEALAYELASGGAIVVLTARREAELRKVQGRCEEPDRHFVLPLDLLQIDSLATAFAKVVDRYGHVDILVHCAGISQRGTAVDTLLAVDRRVMEINYFSVIALTKVVLPSMIERRSGHIVPISSLLGKFGGPQRSAYSASKHALMGFFDSLRAEVHRYGITVTTICPGYVRTNVSYSALQADGSHYGKLDENIRNGIPSDRCAREILRAIVSQKREVYIGGKERWAVFFERFLPTVFNKFVRNYKPK